MAKEEDKTNKVAESKNKGEIPGSVESILTQPKVEEIETQKESFPVENINDNPEAAIHVRQTILNTADFLALHPELGRRLRSVAERHKQIRWFIVPKFRNYLIFYQPFEATIVVVRVLHARRDWMRTFPPASYTDP